MDIQEMANSKPTDVERVFRDRVITNFDAVVSAVRNRWTGNEIIDALTDESWFPKLDGLTGTGKAKQERRINDRRERLMEILTDTYEQLRERSPDALRVANNVRLVTEYAQLCNAAGAYAGAISAPTLDYGDDHGAAG
ncbi:MAG: hypothetical protein ACYCS8_12760 [Acidithiobacillus sp.]